MFRLLCVALVLCCASATFGQVIFAPPDTAQPVVQSPPGVLELQNALLHRPYFALPPSQSLERSLAPFRAPGSSIVIVPSGPVVLPEAAGIDPQTSQPLYFRKRDLLLGPAIMTQPPQTQPLIVPQIDPGGSGPEPGQIIITPWRGGAKTFASR